MPPHERDESAEAEEHRGNLVALSHDLKAALKSGQNSDMTIRLSNGEDLACHRAILCTRSTFFATALKPGRFKEGVNGTIEMLNDPPSAIKALVEFFYTADYKVAPVLLGPKAFEKASDTFLHIAEVYAVAAIYDVLPLQRRMYRQFENLFWLDSAPKLPSFPRALKHVFDWVPAERCQIRQNRYFLSACMHHLDLMKNQREEVGKLAPDFFAHLTKSAWEFFKDDCDACASRWLTRIEGADAVRFDAGFADCPLCSTRVRARFSFLGYGSPPCVKCNERIPSADWVKSLCEDWVSWKESWFTITADELGEDMDLV